MPQVRRVPGVGVVRFPDGATPEIISKAIETAKMQIPSTHAGATPALPIPNTHGASTVGRMGTVPHPALIEHGQTLRDIFSQAGDIGNAAMKMLGLEPFGPQDPAAYSTIDAEQPFGHETADAPGSRFASGARFSTEMPIEVGMIVHHGSPHLFDEFKLSKIGTGEGAQSYGHGLYFAQAPAVARDYAESLASRRATPAVEAEAFYEALGPYSDGSVFFGSKRHLPKKYTKDQFVNDYLLNHITSADFGPEIRTAAESKIGKGHLYEADIPDHHIERMLDWDRPIKEQPAHIQQAARAALGDVQPVLRPDGYYGVTAIQPTGEGHVVGGIMAKTPEEALAEFERFAADASGEDFYRRLGTSEEASAKLDRAGIPGVKYLDQFSRVTDIGDQAVRNAVDAANGNVEQGIDNYLKRVHVPPAEKAQMRATLIKNYSPVTRNFVVFDPRIIQSVSRNGKRVYSKAGVFGTQGAPQ